MNPYQQRYGRLVDVPAAEPNDFITQQLKRQSCRTFDGKPLQPGELELLTAVAQSASTSGMLQTWSVIALTTTEQKTALIGTPKLTQIIGGLDSQNFNAIKSAAVVMIWLADLNRIQVILSESNVGSEHKDMINSAEFHLKAVIDTTIAAQAFFMAAESMGIQGTYCGAIRQLPIEFFRSTYNIPKYTFPIFGTLHGRPTVGHKFESVTKIRLPQDIILHHGTYCAMQHSDELAEYNQVHQIMNNKNIYSFQERVIDRTTPTATKYATGNKLRQQGFDFN